MELKGKVDKKPSQRSAASTEAEPVKVCDMRKIIKRGKSSKRKEKG